MAVSRSGTFRLPDPRAAGIAAVCALVLTVLAPPTPLQAGQEPPAARQAELRNLLVQDCGSCHGLTLAGGLGPPLRGQALAGKPPQYLAATILYGRPGSAMPPWRPFLSDAEAIWLANLLKQRAP